MLPTEGKNEPWKQMLRLINKCPVCNFAYKPDSAKVFANNNNAHFIHIACPSCSSNFMALVMSVGKGTSTMGMVTDLSFEDVKRFHDREAISIDEVIEVHVALNKSEKLIVKSEK